MKCQYHCISCMAAFTERGLASAMSICHHTYGVLQELSVSACVLTCQCVGSLSADDITTLHPTDMK